MALMRGGCPCCRAVLTLPGAFASTGIICATLFLACVAIANVFTCDLLLWQALACKQKDLEGLAGAVGGPYWAVSCLCHLGLPC